MTQKIIKVGTSSAVVLPKAELRRLGLKAGNLMAVSFNAKRKIFEIEPLAQEIDKDTLDWTRKFIKKYRPALEALAKK
jgi:antitoxin component of MazEF toxin-antitoxin module